MLETDLAEPELEQQSERAPRVEYGLWYNVAGQAIEVRWTGYARIPAGQPLTWEAPEDREGITAAVRDSPWPPGWEAGVDGCARWIDGALDHGFTFNGRVWLTPGDVLTVKGIA